MRRVRLTSCCVVLCFAFNTPTSAADFPYWRGPARNDLVAEDSGYEAKAWPLKAPLWQTSVGEGSTSPVVIAGKLYVLGWGQDKDWLHALDAATGKPIWKQSYPAPRYARHAAGDEGLYSGHTATPEYDAATKFLYTLGSDGELRCWNIAKEGELVWRKNLYDDYKMPQRPKIKRSGLRDYGYTTSPLVVGEWLVVEVGGDKGTVMAFDKRTGKELWDSEHKGLAGHTGSVVPITIDSTPCLAVLTLRELLVLRIDKAQLGKTVATFPWETDWANNIQTPTVYGDSLLFGSYHTFHALARVQISLKDGAKKLWQADVASYIGSPIVRKDRVYLGGPALHCLNGQTGKLLWEGGAYDNGASLLLTKDERLIALGSNGTLALIESCQRSPDKYTELASSPKQFPTDAWCHVVLANGQLYGKDRNGLLKCYRLAN